MINSIQILRLVTYQDRQYLDGKHNKYRQEQSDTVMRIQKDRVKVYPIHNREMSSQKKTQSSQGTELRCKSADNPNSED
jgi:hypothetical protein